LGGTTVIVLVTDCVPAVSVMVAVVLVVTAGAVQRNVVELAPVVVPMLPAQVPAALPVKSTTSPTPTRVRVLAPPDGAAFKVALVMVGATGADGVGADGVGVLGVGAVGVGAVGVGDDVTGGGDVGVPPFPVGPSRSSSALTAVDPEGCAPLSNIRRTA
jgi:hypothetical protein